MSDSEILGLNRITKKHLKDLCKKHKLYQTPHLNDQLYLHFQGFQSIENLEEYTGLKCLWLESNALSEIQGLDCQTELKCLFLQNNLIRKIENLQYCTLLDTLNLSSNHITKIENCGIDILPELSTLNLSKNYLKNSDAIKELVNCKNLWSVDLSNNRIDDILVVKIFAKMPELRVLVLQGNPVVSKIPQYRKTMILECKNLTFLDSRPVFPKDRASAEAWKRGGYEEERKELNRWTRLDRKKVRDSVNATIRLRQKHGAGDIQLLESSDDENDKKDQNNVRKISNDGTSSGDLEIIGVSKGLSDSSENFSTNSCEDLSEQKQDNSERNEKDSTEISKTVEIEDNTEDISNNNKICDFEEQVMSEDGSYRNVNSSEKIIEDIITNVLNQEYNIEDKKCLQESCEDNEFKVSSKCEKPEKANKNNYGSSEIEVDVDIRKEDQKLEKSVEFSKIIISSSDFLEHNEIFESVTSSTSSESSFTKISSLDTEKSSSKLETDKDICRSEKQELLQNSVESSSKFSIRKTSSSCGMNESSDMQEIAFCKNEAYEFTESSKENDSSSSYFSEQNESTKSLSFSSCDSSFPKGLFSDTKIESSVSEMEETVVDRSEDQKFLKKSIETNKESHSSFLSLSISDFSEENKSSLSSSESYSETSDLRSSKTLKEAVHEIVLNEKYKLEAFEDIKRDEHRSVSSEFQKIESKDINGENNIENNSKLEIEKEYKVKNEDQDPNQEAEESKGDETVVKNNEEVSGKSNISEFLSEISSIQVENETSITSSNIEKINFLNRNSNSSSGILNETTNISQPLNDTETKIKKIFKMILTDDEDSDTSLDLSTEILKYKTKTPQISSKLPYFEDHNTENFITNEVKIEERSNDSIWQDMQCHLEDKNASSWLEKLLTSEDTRENSAAPRRLIEEINGDDSCLAVYDSSGETYASTWLEEQSYDEESEKPLEEFENGNTLEKDAFLDQDFQKCVNEDVTETSLRLKTSAEEEKDKPSFLSNYLRNRKWENKTEKKQKSVVFNEDRSANELICEIERSHEDNSTTTSTNPRENKYFRNDQNPDKLELGQEVETDLLNEENEEDEPSTPSKKNEDISEIITEDDLLEDHSSSSSWWERRLAAAHIEISKLAPKEKEVGGIEDTEEESQKLRSVEVSEQEEKHTPSEEPAEEQNAASNCLEAILEEIIQIEDEEQLSTAKAYSKNSQNHSDQCAKDSLLSQNLENSSNMLESEDYPNLDDSSSSSDESSWAEPSSISTLREVVTTFNKVVENIPSRNLLKTQLCKELISNPLTKTFSDQTAEEINRQVEELNHQKREQLSNNLDCVYDQREKYDDTLEVVNGRLMVVKRSTGALEELPPPPPATPQSKRTESTKYISCGVSTITSTSCNDNDDDECGTALSEDHHDDDDDEEEEDENDIEQHASDTKIKSIPYSCSLSDVNYCANESVSLSSTGSSTEIKKDEEDNNHYHHHHSDEVDDSQQRASSQTGILYNEIDSELVPESCCKWLKKEEAVASAAAAAPSSSSGPADYELLSKEGAAAGASVGTETRSEFQVELDDAIQSFMDFGENAAALEDIALNFENPDDDDEEKKREV